MRAKKNIGKKVSPQQGETQQPGHELDRLTTEPLGGTTLRKGAFTKTLSEFKDFQKRHFPGRVPSKRYSFCFDFHLSIIRSIQTERVLKHRFLTSDFGRLLVLMPVFLSDTGYDFNSVNFRKFDGGQINKHQNTGPTE